MDPVVHPEQPRVMLVEDNDLVRDALAHFLAPHCHARAVSDAVEASMLMAVWRPDLVITDMRLGEDRRGGLDVLSEARSVAPDAHRVLMSGTAAPAAAYELAHHVFEKPLNPRLFLELLEL